MSMESFLTIDERFRLLRSGVVVCCIPHLAPRGQIFQWGTDICRPLISSKSNLLIVPVLIYFQVCPL